MFIELLQVGLNEQFMVAGLGDANTKQPEEPSNRVVRVLMRRLGMSKTFGENMIFMLNRASECEIDIQLATGLILARQITHQRICACSC